MPQAAKTADDAKTHHDTKMPHNGKTPHDGKHPKGTQAQGKPKKGRTDEKTKHAEGSHHCHFPCELIQPNVPEPGRARAILHPKKDVFVLKVAKVAASGQRTTKLELELVTPNGPERKPLTRLDSKGDQCDPEPCCYCCKKKK